MKLFLRVFFVFSMMLFLTSCNKETNNSESAIKTINFDSNISEDISDTISIVEDISILPNISEEQAFDLLSTRFSDKQWVFENERTITHDDGRSYYLIHAYDASINDESAGTVSYTMGWFCVDLSTGRLYEAYAALDECLIPIDTIEYIHENDAEYKYINSNDILKSQYPNVEFYTNTTQVKKDSRIYNIVFTESDPIKLYCVDAETNEIYLWNIYEDVLVKENS